MAQNNTNIIKVKFTNESYKVIGSNKEGTIPLHYVKKDLIERIKNSDIPMLHVYPMDRPLLQLAHQLGGTASDIVAFINPADGLKTIFFNDDRVIR